MQSLFFHRFSPHHADIIIPAILFCIITDFDFILVHKITKKTRASSQPSLLHP